MNGDRGEPPQRDPERDRKNVRLAIVLGLVALGIYVMYFVVYAT